MSRFVAIPVVASVLLASTALAQLGGVGGGRGGRGGAPGGFRMGNPFGTPAPSWPEQSWLVKVETAGGKTISGTLAVTSVPVDCDLGLYHIKPESVKSVRFTMPGDQPVIRGPQGMAVAGAVTSQSGEEIAGSVIVGNWTVATDLGQVTLDPTRLKSVTFMKKAEPPARPEPPAPAEPPAEKK